MRSLLAGLSLMLVFPALGQADEAADARAIIDQGIKALGGEDVLNKYKASTITMKGELHTAMGKLSFEGEVISQGRDQLRIAVEMDFGGQKVKIMQGLNGKKAWAKLADMNMELDEEKIKQLQEEAFSSWVSTLVPLKDKAFKLTTAGEIQVEGKPAVGVRVSHEGHRDITLYFDKANHLIVKIENRTNDEESGMEVNEETFLSNYKGDSLKVPWKIVVKRDGKLFLDTETTNAKLEEKLADSVFNEP